MTCTTHHHACDCREAKFAELEADRDKYKRLYEQACVKDEGMQLYAEIDRLKERIKDLEK